MNLSGHEIINLYKNNNSVDKISKIFNCSQSKIYTILKENKIKMFQKDKGVFRKGNGGWSKGLTKETDERLKNMAENPLINKKKSDGLKKAYKEGRKISPMKIIGIKEKVSNSLKGGYKSGRIQRNPVSDKQKSHLKLIHKGKHYSPKTEFKKGHKPYFVEDNKRVRMVGDKNPMKRPEVILKHRKNTFKALALKPTSYEKKISELCIESNLPFIYTGNGTFFIGTKNPDFINKEKNIAIEVYNDYWKIKGYGSCENYEKQRGEYFSKYGYKTIFIRTHEITDKNWKEVCLKKII